jgi:acetyl esterase/lipase
MRRMILVAVVAIAGAALTVPASADVAACADSTDTVYTISWPNGVTGRIGLPAPHAGESSLVAFTHGYTHTSTSWVGHIREANAHGAIALALDYRGTSSDATGARGWRVEEGAQDTIDVARAVQAACDADNVILYGVSMGGNTSGLVMAAKPTRADRSPLFDYWVAGEPAANVIETYLEASAVALSGNATAVNAVQDIEEEFGGTFAEVPERYISGAVVSHVVDIAASGVKGVIVAHGFDDGLVPYNQGRELATLLRAAGVPTDFYNAARRETNGTPCGTDNTTLTENAKAPIEAATGSCYTEPLAGHSTESSETSLVLRTGLNAVWDLLEGKALPDNHEFVVDGEAGIIGVA